MVELRKISNNIVQLLFPVIKKSKTIKQISKEFGEATDTSLKELWEKVRPIFIEEFKDEESEKLTEDILDHKIVRREIEKRIKKDTSLKNDLLNLLEKAYKIKRVKDLDNIIEIGDNNNNTAALHNLQNNEINISFGQKENKDL